MSKLKDIIKCGIIGTAILASNYLYYHDKLTYATIHQEEMNICHLQNQNGGTFGHPTSRNDIQSKIAKTTENISVLKNEAYLPEWVYACAGSL